MAPTILVVEDETKIRSLLRGYLERAGFSVLTTGSGAEALTMASSAAPDLILLDLGLPDVPGETITSVDGEDAVLEVLDTGPGVAPEDLPHVFERFYRGRGAEAGAGSGIGLAVVAELVAAHGGEVAARNREGGGAAVHVRLPASGRPSADR
jgi:hypothetical protein